MKDDKKSKEQLIAELKELRERIANSKAAFFDGEFKWDALIESEEKYRNLIERANDGICVVQNTFLEYVNPKLTEIVGYSEEELLKTEFMEYIHPDELSRVFERYTNRMDGYYVPAIYETALVHKDGHRIDVEFNAGVISFRGKPADFVFVRDITKRKIAEEKLKESEWEKALILDTVSEAITFRNLELTIIWANKATCDATDLSLDNIIGDKCYKVWHGREKRCENCPMLRAFETGENITEEVLTPNGRIWLLRCYPIRNTAGKIIGGVEVTREITERKRAEIALRESEERYRLLFDMAPVGIAVHDGEKFILVNREISNMLGYNSVDDMLGMDIIQMVSPESWEAAKLRIATMLEKRESVPPLRQNIIRADGAKLVVEIAGAPLSYHGKRAVMLIVRNITESIKAEEEKKTLERKLMQVQKLEAVGRLAGGIAHEFNNLLNGIIGYAELIREQISVSDPHFRYVELVLKSGLDAAKLTRQILSFSRRSPVEMESFCANDAVREIVEILGKTTHRMVEIVTEFSDEDPFVMGDLARIEQVLINLCVNSCDAMPDGGKLTIKTKTFTLDERDSMRYAGTAPGDYVLFSVCDTGTGMDRETLSRIFDPFFTTKKLGQGTGLGLSIAYNIVHEHKGHITVKSQPGQGTKVDILLPMTEEMPVASKTLLAAPEIHRGEETILVVDDEYVVRNLLVDLLQSRGYKVLTAIDGIEALELFKNTRDSIELVILDIVMPRMDGYETLRRILELDSDVPVLMASGYAQGDIVEKCVAAGAKGFIQKPFQIGEISEKIYRALADEASEIRHLENK